MRILVSVLLAVSLLYLFGCQTTVEPIYIGCMDGQIINSGLREDTEDLAESEWPIDIRSFVAAEHPGYEIDEIIKYNYLNESYYLAKLDNKGYILFDGSEQYICADATFVGGPRLDLTDTTTNVIDTMAVDTLIKIVEQNVCDPDVISFTRQILPLMASGCAYSGCHDAGTAEDGIVLETYSQIRSKVNPSNVNQSKIMKSLNANPSSDKFMPPLPAISFTDEQVQIVSDWISQGANNTDCNTPCNSLNISYANDIAPLLADQCVGCHQPTNNFGGSILDTYANVKFSVNDGSLLGSIKHDPDFDPMPEVSLKLTDCQIAMVENWISEGALNN